LAARDLRDRRVEGLGAVAKGRPIFLDFATSCDFATGSEFATVGFATFATDFATGGGWDALFVSALWAGGEGSVAVGVVAVGGGSEAVGCGGAVMGAA